MKRHPRIFGAPAKSGGSKSTQAMRGLERVAKLARANVRRARAAASIALSKSYRWQLPTRISFLRGEQASGAESSLRGSTERGGSGRGSGDDPGLNASDDRTRDAETRRRHRATRVVDAGARASRRISDLSRAMNLLSRVESGDAPRSASDASRYTTPVSASNTDAKIKASAGHRMRRTSFADLGVLAKVRVPSSGGGMPPPGFSHREFAQPSSNLPGSNAGSGRAAITINSSPTVVINSGTGGGTLQHDVIGALRMHREELFDQLKRESTRRERAQF